MELKKNRKKDEGGPEGEGRNYLDGVASVLGWWAEDKKLT